MTSTQFEEITGFDGEVSVMFHRRGRRIVHAYAEARNVDDHRFGLKRRHFMPIKKGDMWAIAKPVALKTLWARFRRFAN